jgi:hypothetical protein
MSQIHSGTASLAPYTIQPTICTAPSLCKNVSLAVLFGSNGNSHKYLRSQVCVYTYILQCGKAGRAKEILIQKLDSNVSG